jgi:hypothetical protein
MKKKEKKVKNILVFNKKKIMGFKKKKKGIVLEF